MKSKSSRVMHMAHALHEQSKNEFNNPISWSQAMTSAWYAEHFLQWLRKGVVLFTYFKDTDGTMREAKGTLNALLIPEENKPKGTGVPGKIHYEILRYYDLERKAWRSFKTAYLINCDRIQIFQLVQNPTKKKADKRKSAQKEN